MTERNYINLISDEQIKELENSFEKQNPYLNAKITKNRNQTKMRFVISTQESELVKAYILTNFTCEPIQDIDLPNDLKKLPKCDIGVVDEVVKHWYLNWMIHNLEDYVDDLAKSDKIVENQTSNL